MRTYGQYCSLAKALDLLGERWTLLIVRELLIRGPSRYTDLREGLPGIASNLLADRLRALEGAGIVSREEAPPPVATTLFRLTPRGEALKDAVYELGRWGTDLMTGGPAPGDVFRERWIALPVETYLSDGVAEGPPVRVEVRAGGEPVVIAAGVGEVRLESPGEHPPDAVLSGPPFALLGLLSGRLDLAAAEAVGLTCEGNRESVRRLLPVPEATLAAQS